MRPGTAPTGVRLHALKDGDGGGRRTMGPVRAWLIVLVFGAIWFSAGWIVRGWVDAKDSCLARGGSVVGGVCRKVGEVVP